MSQAAVSYCTLQEEAKAIKMFEELLDSSASAAALEASQSGESSTPRRWLGRDPSHSASSETSRTAAATGKAYRALKDLVGAAPTPPPDE